MYIATFMIMVKLSRLISMRKNVVRSRKDGPKMTWFSWGHRKLGFHVKLA